MSKADEVFGTLKPEVKPNRASGSALPVPRPSEPLPLVAEQRTPAAPAPRPEVRVPEPTPPSSAASPRAGTPLALGRPAAEVGRPCLLSPEALRLLDANQTVLPYLYRLLSQRLLADAVRLLAQALPARQRVAWACKCLRAGMAAVSSPEAERALRAALRWVAEPDEATRAACGAAALAAGYTTAAGAVALAAFLSDGDRTLVNRPTLDPRDGLAGQAIANAILLTPPEQHFHFLKEGILLLSSAALPE